MRHLLNVGTISSRRRPIRSTDFFEKKTPILSPHNSRSTYQTELIFAYIDSSRSQLLIRAVELRRSNIGAAGIKLTIVQKTAKKRRFFLMNIFCYFNKKGIVHQLYGVIEVRILYRTDLEQELTISSRRRRVRIKDFFVKK